MLFPSKLELKPSPLLPISFSTRPASKPNHVAGISLPKKVTSAKSNSTFNVTTITKDLNQPNCSVELPPLNQMTRPTSDSSNNIPSSTNIIDVNNNMFCLLSYIKKFLAFSIPKTLILTKIKISRYLIPL